MKNKKLIKKILSAFTISAFFLGAMTPCYKNVNASSNVDEFSALSLAIMASNGNLEGFDIGMIPQKISKYVSYTYVSPENAKVQVQCQGANKEARIPEADGEGSYICFAKPLSSNIVIPSYRQTRTVTFKKAGKTQIVTMSFPYQIAKINKDNNEKIEQNAGDDDNGVPQAIEVTLKIKVPNNMSTSISDGVDATDSSLLNVSSTNEGVQQRGTTTRNPDGSITISTCSDGTLFCPNEQISNSGGGTPTDDDNDGLKDKPDSLSPTITENPFDNDSNDNYKNLLDDLLDYSNKNTDPYNSSDSDWANSNGGSSTGDGNLDDWFSGVPEEENVPTDMTTDDTGVDDVLTNNSGSYQDGYTTNPEYQDIVLDYNGENNNNDDGLSSSVLPMKDLDTAFQDGLDALSGNNNYELNGDNANLLGSMDATSKDGSLGDKLKMLLGDTNANTRRGTASDQELYDVAKKWLLANGFTMADIRSGKNYDANSAYTEPTVAWDMNRITTLLKGRKISLTSPTEVKKDTKSKSTLSKSVSNTKK